MVQKQAQKNSRVIDVLLQFQVAQEDTKFGLDEKEILELLEYYEAQQEAFPNVRICGLMAMASFTENTEQLTGEFRQAKALFDNLKQTTFFTRPYFNTLSMGMSGDYERAIAEGSTAVRIGSLIFGERGTSL
jgi:pyridoxal phosphate enzyme (YggS family)